MRHPLKAAPTFVWSVALALCVSSACSSCSSCGTPATPPTGGTTTTTPASDEAEAERTALLERVHAVVRIEDIRLVQEQTGYYLEKALPEGEGAPSFDLLAMARERLGEEAVAGLRPGGNVELIWLDALPGAPTGGGASGGWALVLPVEEVDAYLSARGAAEAVDGLRRFEAPSGPVWAVAEPAVFARGKVSDVGPRVVLAGDEAAARHIVGAIAPVLREQTNHIEAHLWPSRLGLTERWARSGMDLTQRLAASGHGLVPARASLVNIEILLYRAIGDPENWPEPLFAKANYKIRKERPKNFTVELETAPIQGRETLAAIYGLLQARKPGLPPRAGESPLGSVRMQLNRAAPEQLLDVVAPVGWRQILATRGEQPMIALTGTAKDLLEYDRGPTLIAVYPQEVPLSGEVLIGWEGQDLDRVAAPSTRFHETLIRNLWASFHLAELDTIERAPFEGAGGKLVGEQTTFEVLTQGRAVRMGSCWGVADRLYFAYFGVDPCAKLEARAVLDRGGEALPVEIEADLKAALDLLYMPPGKRLRGAFSEHGGERARVGIRVHAREGRFDLSVDMPRGEQARALLSNAEELERAWAGGSEVDVADLLQRASMEQAIYQDPGLAIVGPPGLMGGAPPAMFLGLPFSLAPTPPDQLKRAVLGDPVTGELPDEAKQPE